MEAGATGESGPTGATGPGEADQAELRERLEEQLRQIRVQDLLLESVASVLNLAARRITKADERDLEQGRIGIEAVRSLLELLEPGAREQVREALSQIQVLYARAAQGDGGGEGGGAGGAGGEGGEPSPGGRGGPTKPDRPSGLWVPPGTS